MLRNQFIIISVVVVLIVAGVGYFWPYIWWSMVVVGPIIFMGIYDMIQTRHSIRRIFPFVGRARWWMESLRPKVYQYFVESDIEGRPIDRNTRSIVYQRAKKVLDTNPFGTQLNTYNREYEWMNHSITPKDMSELDMDPRVKVGGPACKKPYRASIFNISAMSYGSLSKNAVMALNGGAKIGGFAHNTGEGAISPYHLKFGGDLIWQIGTGYFGCRTKDGQFDPEQFKEKSRWKQVKMIELKLSQGAKPGHGGILPAKKNTPEIAEIRGVEPHTDVLSPPFHKAFSNPVEMLEFIQQLRELSGGKPVGFKLCVGSKCEFLSLCKAMFETNIMPDFITVDGGEGGTGAAPLEFSDSVGMPLRDGLAYVFDALVGFGIKRHIKIIASGKVFSGFDIVKNLALEADLCYSARGMMLALGCIQALECNLNTCPTGVTTQNSELYQGLVVSDKKQRVANYHRETIESVMELVSAAGLDRPSKLHRGHIYRRISPNVIQRYDEAYPYVLKGCLEEPPYPEMFKRDMANSRAESFVPLVQ